MRIAFVSSLLPEQHPRSGFAVANRAVVDGLAELGHDVVSLGLRQSEQDEPYGEHVLLGTTNLENAHADGRTKLGWAVRAVAGGLPFAAAKVRGLGAGAVASAIEGVRADALVLNSYQMAAAFPKLTERPFAYVAHNVESRTAAANADVAETVPERAMFRRDGRILARLETELGRRARHVWCLAEEDRSTFPVPPERSSVLPLLFPRVEREAVGGAKPFDAVMIGTWTWEANATGLRWFARKVVPLLPPELRIAVAGSVPDDLDLSDERIVAMGRVESAAGFLAQGHVVALVAQGGTGVQLKTVEAFQRGLATVATPASVRGIEERPTNCTLADGERAFATALVAAAMRGREGHGTHVDPTAWIDRQRQRQHEALAQGMASLG